MADRVTILLNHVYYSPVGHVVEALQYAKGFHAANPASEVHLALSEGTPWELAAGCPWVAATYRVPLREPRRCDLSLPEMPPVWDYIVDNNLMRLEAEQPGELVRPPGCSPAPLGWAEAATLAYFARTDSELVARRGRGVLYPKMRLPEGLRYEHTPIRLAVPDTSRTFVARYAHTGPKICVLPAGSGPAATYPSAATWVAIIGALRERFPTARFYLTGSRRPGRHRDLTTTAHRSGSDLLGDILAADAGLTDCCDIGLWPQVALLEMCDLLVSPHSGFSFLALCVGTPWLAISGGNWPEGFYNGIPFYSVLPDNPDYPYLGAIRYDYDGPTIPDMRKEALLARLPEIVEAASFLLDPATTYDACAARHSANVARSRVRRDQIPLPPG
jgi:hypothetical protein